MSRTFRSYAKINLDLEVLGRRPDGFHELRTLFQTVSLHDHVTVARSSGGIALSVSGADLAADASNLAYRAAEAFLERWGEGGVRLSLDKRIPLGGGLGGGSSNAATVLLALRRIFGAPGEVEELVPVAASLGADVPFFLVGGTALGLGRGDRIEMVPDLSEQPLWLVTPALIVSTAEVFSRLGAGDVRKEAVSPRRVSFGSTPVEVMGSNDLEASVRRLYPPVDDVYNALVQTGAQRVAVSGSGGTVFAFFRDSPEEAALVARMPAGSSVVRARTLSRRSVARSFEVEERGES